jgi:hypothetical protein
MNYGCEEYVDSNYPAESAADINISHMKPKQK